MPSQFEMLFRKSGLNFEIVSQHLFRDNQSIRISGNSNWEDIKKQLSEDELDVLSGHQTIDALVVPNTGFLEIVFSDKNDNITEVFSPTSFEKAIRKIMHIPGLRTVPLRAC